MLDPHFVILGALLSLTGALSYARETLRGRTRPNRVTWLLWTVAPLIAFAVELADRVGLPALLTFSVGFGPLLVLLASFAAPTANWRLGRIDYACGALSVLALVAWRLSGSGAIAICLSIAADALASVPTVIKAVQAPQTEHPAVFRNGFLNAAITLLVIDHWTFAAWGFPVYILVIAGTLYVLVRFHPQKRRPSPAAGASAS